MRKPLLSHDELVTRGAEYFLRHLSLDCVIFGYHDRQLKVLLLKWKDSGRWSLPGGFIQKEESLEDAAERVVAGRTGLAPKYLHQFHAFGDPNRGKRNHGFEYEKNNKVSWLEDRFVTIGYWSVVEFSKVIPTPDVLTSECRWWNLDQIPELILDHRTILDKALVSLRQYLNDFPLGQDLLPQQFTMPELQRLYETILGKSLDRRNFQKKLLGLNVLTRLAKRKTGGAHKAPYLYKFHSARYARAQKTGWKFGSI
jgi:ADP-ribose pyrophosphatase YjhB (NUDIX family)